MIDVPVQLAIIIVNYKTPELVQNCIATILSDADNLPPFRMYIVDNHSEDGSVDIISSFIDANHLNDKIILIDSPNNGGYAYGNNLALREVLAMQPVPGYIWLLNPDTTIYPGAARSLIEFLKQNPSAGVAGSRLEDKDGTVQCSAFRFPGPISELLGNLRIGILDNIFSKHLVPMPPLSRPFQADWLAGASVMMKKEVVESIGLMDEEYFLYFEEVDYFLKAKRKGWELWYVPNSRVHHIVGASTGISDTRKKAKRRPQYWFDSRRRFFIKNFNRLTVVLTDIAHITGFILWRVRRWIQQKPDLDPPGYLGDLIRNSVFFKGFSLEK